MTRPNVLNRRRFLAQAATTAAAGVSVPGADRRAGLPADGAGPAPERLALDGGTKAVPGSAPALVRWGAPERGRLNALADQESLFYWKGPQTTALIERFRGVCPVPHVMTCSSGSAALHIAVAAAGIGPGDEVITTPITDLGTVIGVIYQQAVPVFADLLPGTWNLDPADVERRITSRTRAIIAVHLAGNPCDLDALSELAARRGLVLIEDAAQAWGARSRGRPVGSVGHFACFSLQNSKQVTCGDGGVVGSRDDRFGPLLQRFGDKGFNRTGGSGLFEQFAPNYRMSEPQAAVAAAQLERLESIAAARARLGNRLTGHLRDLPGIVPHDVHPDDRCTYWFYAFRLRPGAFRCDRAQWVKALAAEGAPVGAGYIPVPLYGNPVFQNHAFFAGRWPVREFGLTTMDYTRVRCPEAEAILATGVRVFLHEAMTDDYVDALGAAIRKVARHYARA